MRIDTDQFLSEIGPHLAEDEVIAYHRGSLRDNDREVVQYHLIQCDQCLVLFRSVLDYFDPLRKDETAVSSDEISQRWGTFRNRAEAEGLPQENLRGRGVARFRWLGAAAALLIGLTVVAAIWIITLRREKSLLRTELQNTAGQSLADQERLEANIKELERQNSALLEQAQTTANVQPQRPQVSQPELNVPVFDVYSNQSTRRAGDNESINRIKTPANSKSLVLILNGEGQSDYASYEVEILNRKSQAVWRGSGLTRNSYGNFVIKLDKEFLSDTGYRLKLFGVKAGRTEPVAEYVVRIE